MPATDTRGLIFDIQGHSIHDGPGTRTLVFLSGCPLRCKWCSNPEGLLLRQRLMYKPRLCRNCPARCATACSRGAVQALHTGQPIVLHRDECDCCEAMHCLSVCYSGALQSSGRWYSTEDVMRVFNRDRRYWGDEGGVTLTGGEPLLQEAFVLDLLQRCHDSLINTCVETSAHVPRSVLQAVLPYVDWLFVDIKHMNSGRHLAGTGVPNDTVLENVRWIASADWAGRLVLRTPVIPGFNDDAPNAEATAAFLTQIGVSEINLLPFHRLGTSKYEQLGMTYEYAEQPALAQESLESLATIYRGNGITCHVGADTPF